MSWHRVWLALVAALTLTSFSRQLKADFIPPYDVPHGFLSPFTLANGSLTPFGSWTLQTLGTPPVYASSLVQSPDPSQVYIQTGISVLHGVQYSLDLQLTHPIVASGTLSFDYTLSLLATGPAAGWNYGGYLLDGVLTKLSAGTGSVSVPVRAGDVFGFETYATVNCVLCEPPFNTAGATTFTITHFNAPVPEPSVLLLSGTGAVTMVAGRIRRRLRFRGSGRSASR